MPMSEAIFRWLTFSLIKALSNSSTFIETFCTIKGNTMSRKFYSQDPKDKDQISQRLRDFFFLYYEDFEIDMDIVRKLEIPKATISRWLSGDVTGEFLDFLQKEYNLNIQWLFTGRGKPFRKM